MGTKILKIKLSEKGCDDCAERITRAILNGMCDCEVGLTREGAAAVCCGRGLDKNIIDGEDSVTGGNV